MIIIEFFHLIIKSLIETNHPLSRLLFALLLILSWYTLIYLKYISKKSFTIQDYVIESKFLLIFILSTFFIGYILGFIYLRIINTQRTLNIYKISSWFIQNIKEMSYFSIFANICLVIAILLLLLFIINWYRKIILKYYLQIHFLIISYYPEYNKPPISAFFYWHFDDEQPYESLKYLVDRWVVFCRSFYKLLRILPETKGRIKIEDWLYAHYKLYGLILIIILAIYDILFNEGNITKVFFALPFIFFYYLLCKYEEVLFLYSFEQEECIVSYLYFTIIPSEDPNIIEFSNEKIIPVEDFNNLLLNIIPSKHR